MLSKETLFYRRPNCTEEQVSQQASAVGMTYVGDRMRLSAVRSQKRDIWAYMGHAESVAEGDISLPCAWNERVNAPARSVVQLTPAAVTRCSCLVA